MDSSRFTVTTTKHARSERTQPILCHRGRRAASLGLVGEVFQVSELQEEAEEQVQGLDPAAVHGDVQQAADDVAVLGHAAVQEGAGQLPAGQKLLQLGRPLLHQAVDAGHRSAVLNAGRRFAAMQSADALHPAVHRPGVGPRTGNACHLLQLGDDTDMYWSAPRREC